MKPSGKSRMRRFAIPLTALLFGLAVWWVTREEESLPPAPVAASTKPIPLQAPPPPPALPDPVVHPILETASNFQSSETSPEEDLETVHAVLDSYRRAFEGNPVGENEEIFTALRGENPKRIRFLPDDFPGLQPSGIVHDRWGTPWRFHALSGKEMEITSAGPDRQFGTDDDLVSH